MLIPSDDSKSVSSFYYQVCKGESQMVKSLPAVREIQVRSLGREDPLEKGMATHCQYSCLENSMDREAWWATVPGVRVRHN